MDDPHKEVEIKPQLKPTPAVVPWEGRLGTPKPGQGQGTPAWPRGECPFAGTLQSGHREWGNLGDRTGSLSPGIAQVLLPGAVTLRAGPTLTVPHLHPSGERGGRGDGGAPQATFPAGLNSCPEVWLRKKTQNLPTICTSCRLNPLNQLGRLCVYGIYKRLLRAPTKENTLILIAVDTEGKNTEV